MMWTGFILICLGVIVCTVVHHLARRQDEKIRFAILRAIQKEYISNLDTLLKNLNKRQIYITQKKVLQMARELEMLGLIEYWCEELVLQSPYRFKITDEGEEYLFENRALYTPI